MRDTRIGAGRAYAIDAVDNALSILLMLRTRTGLRVTDVSDELGVARPTAHRVLSALAPEASSARSDADHGGGAIPLAGEHGPRPA